MTGNGKMTDAEVVATWMEKRPEEKRTCVSNSATWWAPKWSVEHKQYIHIPNNDKTESLDGLRTVETKIIRSNPCLYQEYAYALTSSIVERFFAESAGPLKPSVIHASASQKLRALAAVLRPEVEAS